MNEPRRHTTAVPNPLAGRRNSQAVTDQNPGSLPDYRLKPPASMSPDAPEAAAVKAEIDRLMERVTDGDFSILDRLYHRDMKVFLFDESGTLNTFNKKEFIQHVVDSTSDSERINVWARYRRVEANATNGHVLISRKVNLTGEERLINLSIDLIFAANRWQIVREVIFVGREAS